jgi:hypothetical protein
LRGNFSGLSTIYTEMTSARPLIRHLWMFAFAIILGLRLLTPAGFMPAFDHGQVTIVACPDGEPAPAPMSGHHHHNGKKTLHQVCPYASAAGLAGVAEDAPVLPALLLFGIALLLGRSSGFVRFHRDHDRPPMRGPPLPA